MSLPKPRLRAKRDVMPRLAPSTLGAIMKSVDARGMNLGIEDAWFFAQLVARDQRSRYEGLRYPIDRRVVRQVNVFSRIVAFALLRRLLAPLLRLGLPTANMLAIITGTDHPLGEFAPAGKTAVEPAAMQRT